MEILLEVGGFDMERGVEMTLTQVCINVQKRGESVPSDLDGITVVEAFKQLGEGIGTMRPKEQNVIDDGFLESGVK
jgi:hypothetical protein